MFVIIFLIFNRVDHRILEGGMSTTITPVSIMQTKWNWKRTSISLISREVKLEAIVVLGVAGRTIPKSQK